MHAVITTKEIRIGRNRPRGVMDEIVYKLLQPDFAVFVNHNDRLLRNSNLGDYRIKSRMRLTLFLYTIRDLILEDGQSLNEMI
jgi:hypothetical protein